MKSTEDRRCPSVVRVSHTALVDICSLEQEGSPFQGESCDISGRGMLVRGSYLPEIGEALVCRFDHDDEEVLVEGRVAWRSEGEDSGEFGVQFTALDADSADLLRGLGQPKARQTSLIPTTLSLHEDADDEDSLALESGERVRLHIDGLGAPMKASVHEGTGRKVKVGSALEFLKMGRTVQLETVEGGQRRGALVDSVNIVIHPTTRIPELVVQLRYEGITPSPLPVQATESDRSGTKLPSRSAQAHIEQPEQLADEEEHALHPTAEALRARLGEAAHSASSAAHKAVGFLSQLAQTAKESIPSQRSSSLRKTSARISRPAAAERVAAKRRTQSSVRPTQSTPSHLRSGIHDLHLGRGARSTSSETRSSAPKDPKTKVIAAQPARLRPAALALGALVLFGGSTAVLRGWDNESVQTVSDSSAASAKTKSTEEATGSLLAQKAHVPAKAPHGEEEGGVVAEVPLFGPQAVATPVKEIPLSAMSDAEAERRAAAATVSDQSFGETEDLQSVEEAKPWGRGRLYLPTIHRIRLDGAADSLSGAISSDGFTVVIPGHKLMESGKAIQKRDKRIIAVKADNEGPNAKVRFEFRGPVPPYRVRLRQDFVEFLISAPEDSVAQL